MLTLGSALVVLVLALPAFSLGAALRAPGNLSASEKSVEWMRDHGMGGMVNRVESWWFSNHQAKQGGEPDHAIAIAAPPDQAGGASDGISVGRHHASTG